MVIVIAIAAIMSVIAIPFFGGFVANRNLKSAARDLAGDIFATRERSLAEDRLYQITFAGSTYNILQCNDNTTNCAAGYSVIGTKSPVSFDNGITITAVPAGNTIQFQPRGTVTAGNVTLKNSRNSVASITISLTGRTSVDWTGTLH